MPSLLTVIVAMLPWIGSLAALLTSLSYIPQVRKAWRPSSTQDLALKMLVILTSGLFLWLCYGGLAGDWIIVAGSGVGCALSFTVLVCKLRDLRDGNT